MPHSSLPLRRQRRLRGAARLAAVATIALGCVGLLGWQLDVTLLSSVVAGGSRMVPNTAVSLVLSGAALLLLAPEEPARWRCRLGRALALVVLAVGVATLAEYGFSLDLGVDRLLPFRAYRATRLEGLPSRSAPPTALALVLASASLIALGGRSRRLSRVQELGAMAAAFIGGLSLLAHGYGAASLYRLSTDPAAGMALHTALALTLLGVGLLCARPERGVVALITSDASGGFAARRLLPAALGFPCCSGSWCSWPIGQGCSMGLPRRSRCWWPPRRPSREGSWWLSLGPSTGPPSRNGGSKTSCSACNRNKPACLPSSNRRVTASWR